MGSRAGIETLLRLMATAFGAQDAGPEESQALLQNLATVSEERWRALPARAARSIESIVLHVGSCKVMYADYAFRAGTLSWDDRQVQPWPDGEAPMAETLEWLQKVHAELVADVAALRDDSELARPRRANWGDNLPTRWLIAALITHDSYHAGEINHLRSMFGADDRWRYIQDGFG